MISNKVVLPIIAALSIVLCSCSSHESNNRKSYTVTIKDHESSSLDTILWSKKGGNIQITKDNEKIGFNNGSLTIIKDSCTKSIRIKKKAQTLNLCDGSITISVDRVRNLPRLTAL